jgi:hypothetical protein
MNLQYDIIKAAPNEKLASKSYNVLEEKCHPQAFGSRYIVWLIVPSECLSLMINRSQASVFISENLNSLARVGTV